MTDPPPKQKSSRTFVHFIPILLMVLIGIIQISVSLGSGLIAYNKGGGFGMFSQIDASFTRRAYVVLITDQDNRRVLLGAGPEDYLWLLKCMKSSPTDARMVNIARILSQWMQDPSSINLNKQKLAKILTQIKVSPEIKLLRLEIWRSGFSSDTQTVTLKPLKSITINWPEGKLLNTMTPSPRPVSP